MEKSSTAIESPPRIATDSPAVPVGVLGDRTVLIVGAIFFLSGIPALVYQLAWQRILALHSGVGVYSVAMIVAAFMAGLGIGSYVGGAASVRLTAREALRLFAGIELGIGLFGSLSTWLYYDLLYLRVTWFYESAWLTGVGHFFALIVPTGLMGMSLPVLVRAVVSDMNRAGESIGYLYGVNVLGAAVGAWLTPWVFMRVWGVQGAIMVAAALNIAAGLAALFFSRRRSDWFSAGDSQSRRGVEHMPPRTRHSFGLWVLLYALCGFNGLALEILWFRLCDVAAKSTAFTFGSVLAVYLTGLGLGSLFAIPRMRKITHPLQTFLRCQIWILLYSMAVILLLVWLPAELPGMNWLVRYWRGYDGVVPGQSDTGRLWVFYFLIPVVLFALPTALMGVAFCVLQRAVQNDRHTSGFKVGVLQSANIAGCVTGSLAIGLILLDQIGTAGTLRALAGVGLIFVVLGIRAYGRQFLPAGAALVAGAVLMPANDRLWLRLHGADAGTSPWSMVEEDATSVVAVTREDDSRLRISVDGKGHSWLPYGSIHSYLGALPAVVHREPRQVAIVGLGSGDTAWAAACRPETERVTVFELCAPQQRLLARLNASARLPQLSQFLLDPRVHIEVSDGRNALARSTVRFDIIEADASRPQSSYSGNLYSVEFFELCADRLQRGGIMCTWSPTRRVYATFCSVFPHVLDVNHGEILLGSLDAFDLNATVWEERIRRPAVSSYLGEIIANGLVDYSKSCRPAALWPTDPKHLNRDLFPRDEFHIPGG